MSSAQEIAKVAAGKKAAELIQPGMLVGLGTGSTASHFISALAEKVRTGLAIHAVASSERSRQQAINSGITVIDINTLTTLDITVDGADEIDPQKQMIKGGGGALVREKIIASISRELVIIVDEKKRVEHLGRFPLPVEIIPFAYPAIIDQLSKLGYSGSLRKSPSGENYLSDNGNYIYDIQLPYPCKNPEQEHQRIRSTPCVVDTGFFLNMAGRVIVGHEDGSITFE